jgi:hypothetical protein
MSDAGRFRLALVGSALNTLAVARALCGAD